VDLMRIFSREVRSRRRERKERRGKRKRKRKRNLMERESMRWNKFKEIECWN
jgi:hypothetical protein